MASLTMPFVIVNVGGEMMYILDQRLSAQNIAEDRGLKVREDLLQAMFNGFERWMQPQPPLSMAATRQLFEQFAHSSIMKLNQASMSKLFDLMLMGVKLQLMSISDPTDLIGMSVNHLNSMMLMVVGSSSASLLEGVKNQLQTRFSAESPWTLYRVRGAILTLLQNKHVKVSLFLSKHLQNNSGMFNLPSEYGARHAGVPGTVLKLNHIGEPANTVSLTVLLTNKFVKNLGENTIQGLNLYAKEVESSSEETKNPKERQFESVFQSKRGAVAKWELNELSDMIGDSAGTFHIDLFEGEEVTEEVGQPQVIAKTRNEAVEKFKQDFELDPEESKKSSQDDELLDLL